MDSCSEAVVPASSLGRCYCVSGWGGGRGSATHLGFGSLSSFLTRFLRGVPQKLQNPFCSVILFHFIFGETET